MKRLVIYVLILALVWALPLDRTDIAQLRPVEVIAVYRQGDIVTICTDTDDAGQGRSPEEALKNMHDTSTAVIYLDTAQYLIMSANAEADVQAIRNLLKKRTKLCMVTGEVDMQETAKFLRIHKDLPTLRSWMPGMELPILKQTKNRLKLA